MPLKVGAPVPSHLGTRETANPNRSIPEFLTFRLYYRPPVNNQLSNSCDELLSYNSFHQN